MEKIYYVWATDKFLSGWGMAKGKIHKQIVICENTLQANLICEGFRSCKSEFKNLGISTKKPYFNPKMYTTTTRKATEWTRFMPF